MASYFYLELDTTSPFIEILAPSYATPQTYVEITIESNELLDTYHDVYAIDSKGERHDITLEYNYNSFQGVVLFNSLPFGMVSIYARVKDSVGNLSNVAQKNINLIESDTLSLEVGAYSKRLVSLNKGIIRLETNSKTDDSEINIKESSMDVSYSETRLESDWGDRSD